MTSGPIELHLGVAELTRADELYATVLGGERLTAGEDLGRWALPPGLVVTAEVGPRGPTGLTLATDDLDAVVAWAAHEHVATETRDDRLVVTDDRLGGGELTLVVARDARGDLGEGRFDDHLMAPGPSARVDAGRGTCSVHRFDHVCLAVPDLALAADLAATMGGTPVIGGDGHQGGRVLQFKFRTGVSLELVTPTGPGPVRDFLDRRDGRAGVQHATLLVDDLLVALAALEQAGFATVGTDTTTQPSWHETYIRPRSADGMLLQLVQTSAHHPGPLTNEQVRDVLAGHYIAHDYRMHRIEEVAP